MNETSAQVYCPNSHAYQRFETRPVRVGSVVIGGSNPIRVQSMTTTDTMNTEATVAQSIRMIEAGCELVRITAPSKKDAENLEHIKAAIRAAGFDTPLVADIHFTPNAAEIAASIVEKVRVNPGNYADKKKFENIEYTDESYQAELERIRHRFSPLVALCKEHGTAMRIGTNHGSLSDRILSRYGDTPLGMVESAMEFLRICRDMDYHDVVISMKASNPQVMVQAYRLLVNHMMEAGMNYPLHLGVTEAGDGEDGRIKSAVGIGTLLEDGLGDTVRVSLTEEPEAEIPVAQKLVERYQNRPDTPVEAVPRDNDAFTYERRKTREVLHTGDRNVPCVVHDLSRREKITPASLFPLGYRYSVQLDKWNIADLACDFVYAGSQNIDFEIPGTLSIIHDFETWQAESHKDRRYPLLSLEQWQQEGPGINTTAFVETDINHLNAGLLDQLKTANVILVLTTQHAHGMAEQRAAVFKMMHADCDVPVIVRRDYDTSDEETFMLHSATDLGALLLDGLGDGIWLNAPHIPLARINQTAFGILQATRTRISKTEYISCPSCGRTLFDLQETTAKIRARTHHLKGVKIGIMGCIVNGPGEMADADYGYVGTGVGKITLYREKEVVKRNVDAEHAVDELIELIRSNGDWVEPATEE
ncbi:MAG: 4-hydroxy-3-methylbut-2-en-1-yl diphosphate synthase [Cryomorphaceae bacterium]|nr:MAG: 4-hydroxy-3-methylbut-2-en-1-yl diphosphate synthase [Cryomorphaceae bacterium]